MPNSRQARMIRKAISPRLATRIRLNTSPHPRVNTRSRATPVSTLNSGWPNSTGCAVLDQHGDDPARDLGRNLVEHLHGLDDADGRFRPDVIAHLDERRRIGIGGGVERADHRALDHRDVRRPSARAAAGPPTPAPAGRPRRPAAHRRRRDDHRLHAAARRGEVESALRLAEGRSRSDRAPSSARPGGESCGHRRCPGWTQQVRS